jgi:hypothetical protein
MTIPNQWVTAFARQAQADLETWERLKGDAQVPECHRLQFLQMACEKLTKAHLCKSGADPKDIQSSHAYIAKNLPVVIRQLLGLGFSVRNPNWVQTRAKYLANEIELLAPAVRRGGQRPDNCEYPWEDAGGQLHSPLDWTFPTSRILLSPAGRTFLKLIRAAISGLLAA